MPRFFTGNINGEHAEIRGEDARHIALSLRMKIGEHITICDAKGTDYQCILTEVCSEHISMDITESFTNAAEPSIFITLYQALPKADKMELIVQKSVELGVSRIVPVLTHRCVSRPDAKAMAKKLERYNKIALEAAKQCGRGLVPEVSPMMEFLPAIEEISKSSLGLFFYENADESLKNTLSKRLQKEVSILIGSEGGFEIDEAKLAIQKGLCSVSLGARVLRCETAPMAAITAILYESGDI